MTDKNQDKDEEEDAKDVDEKKDNEVKSGKPTRSPSTGLPNMPMCTWLQVIQVSHRNGYTQSLSKLSGKRITI